jgi:hypothetical protein
MAQYIITAVEWGYHIELCGEPNEPGIDQHYKARIFKCEPREGVHLVPYHRHEDPLEAVRRAWNAAQLATPVVPLPDGATTA